MAFFDKLEQSIKNKQKSIENDKKEAEIKETKSKSIFCDNLLKFIDTQLELLIKDGSTDKLTCIKDSVYSGLLSKKIYVNDQRWTYDPIICKQQIINHITEKYNTSNINFNYDKDIRYVFEPRNDCIVPFSNIHVGIPEKQINILLGVGI